MSHARHFERERPNFPGSVQARYGVLVGTVKDGVLQGGKSPHYEIWVAAGEQNFRVAVNVQSVDGSEVLAHFDPKYVTSSPALDIAALAGGPPGFSQRETGPDGNGIDYLRANLFDITTMQPVPDLGGNVSLGNLLDAQIERAKADNRAVAIVFGNEFRDGGTQSRDQTFGFTPEQGLHDIHMMQGNAGSFERDNTTHGDGALFIRFTGGETVALFIRFATQGTESDDQGNPTAIDR
ncbi:DUF2278 family protein [Rhodopila sp.]|uniref:DUF2278 family protein n=1 Tax=Rhodopila sp. TaxID=2480087 RepID=UPI003D0BCBA0